MNNFFALKNKNFRMFVISQFASLTGGYIQNVTLSALITSSTQSSIKLGWFLAISYLPVFLLSYFTSKLCLKISVVKILRITEIILLGMSVIPVLFKLNYFMLLVFGGLWGVVRAFQTPAASSMPKLICDSDILKSAVATNNLSMSFARATGPIIAGILYTAFDFKAAFIANAISFIPSLILLFKIKSKNANIKTQNHGRIRISIPLLLLVFAVSLVGTSYNIIFTGISKNLSLARIWFSVFMASVGAGAVIGSFIFKKPILLSALGISLMAFVLGVTDTLWIICPAVVLYGLCDYLFFTSALTKIQTDNNKETVPQAMGIYTAVTTGALPLGYLLTSFVSQNFGISVLLFTISAVTVIAYLLFFGKIR